MAVNTCSGSAARNRNDPVRVEIAQFLKGMERGKAQYIVDTVTAYQNGEAAGISVLSGTGRIAR